MIFHISNIFLANVTQLFISLNKDNSIQEKIVTLVG